MKRSLANILYPADCELKLGTVEVSLLIVVVKQIFEDRRCFWIYNVCEILISR